MAAPFSGFRFGHGWLYSLGGEKVLFAKKRLFTLETTMPGHT